MKRTLIVLTLAAALATAAFAQQHRHGMNMAGGPGGGPGMMEHGRIIDLLQLTADQKAQWEALHQQLATNIQPLLDQRSTAVQQLQTLVGAASPDATAIGKQVLAVQAINNQIRAAHDATEQQIKNILTPDQKTKFEAFLATRPEPMGGGLGLCGGMMQGPGSWMGPGSCPNCPIH